MSLYGDASVWAKIGLVLIFVALVLSAVGFGTNYWMSEETIRDKVKTSVGFFKAVDCSIYQTSCLSSSVPDYIQTGSFTCTMVLAGMILGLIFITIVMYAAYVATSTVRKRGVQLTIVIFGVIGGVLGFIMMAVWLAQLPNYFFVSWSFGISIFAVVLFVVSTLLLLHDMKKHAKQKVTNPQPPPKKNRVTPPLPERTPSVPPFTPDWEKQSRYNTPAPTKKSSPKPSPRAVPRTMTVTPTQVQMERFSQMSQYTVTSPRRYGTPLASTRYDNRAR